MALNIKIPILRIPKGPKVTEVGRQVPKVTNVGFHSEMVELSMKQAAHVWALGLDRMLEWPPNDSSVCETTLLLRKPLPCSPAAEAALKPLIWCSES